MEYGDLSNSALVNWTWNSVANRRLWRIFRLHIWVAVSVATLHHCALLHLPARARCVRHLIIGPITWQWDADLLQRMIYVWAAVPLLSKLTFDATYPNPDPTRGGGFAPVIRGFLDYSTYSTALVLV